MAFSLYPKIEAGLSTVYRNVFHHDAFLAIFGAGALAAHAALWVTIAWQWPLIGGTESKLMILHYKVGVGPDLIGPWYQFFVIPLLGLLIMAINGVLAHRWHSPSPFASRSLIVTCFASQLALWWAARLLIQVNIF